MNDIVKVFIRMTLPPKDDSTFVTKAHVWRPDIYLAGYQNIHTKSISMNTVKLFGKLFKEIGKSKGTTKPSPTSNRVWAA